MHYRIIEPKDNLILANIIRDNLKAAIHLYEKCGYKLIEKPKEVVHSSMNRFYLKELI